ncbi:NAD(P)-dependent oxidoreductase [Marinibacterium sp. SX1]|uniref:NAD(P)-dependent oxidoreductase n=1 Tax=Marinibacterium sp. SX1 TaxID=3388424 RepID=UPI003D174E9A
MSTAPGMAPALRGTSSQSSENTPSAPDAATDPHTPRDAAGTSPAPRRIIVFGATGSVGRLAVAALLDEGHAVTAFARRPDRLVLDHPRLARFAGDATDPAGVRRALAGHDAVIVALGAGASRKSRVRSDGTLTIIRAMQAEGLTRLVCQSTLGAHESWSNLNFFWKRIMFGALLRPVFRDHELQESLVRASGLDWTILRPSAFADTPVPGPLKEDFPPNDRALNLKIGRAEVAAALARLASSTGYMQRAVAISH